MNIVQTKNTTFDNKSKKYTNIDSINDIFRNDSSSNMSPSSERDIDLSDLTKVDIPERIYIKYAPSFYSDEYISSFCQWLIETKFADKKNENLKWNLGCLLKAYFKDSFDIPYIISQLKSLYTEIALTSDDIYKMFSEYDEEFYNIAMNRRKLLEMLTELKQSSYYFSPSLEKYINNATSIFELNHIDDYLAFVTKASSNAIAIEARKNRIDIFVQEYSLPIDDVVSNLTLIQSNSTEELKKPKTPEKVAYELGNEYINDTLTEVIMVFTMGCKYTALEMVHHPYIRNMLWEIVKNNVYISTTPTEEGCRVLEINHELYRTKRLKKRHISSFISSDGINCDYFDIETSEKKGYITVQIEVDINKTISDEITELFTKALNGANTTNEASTDNQTNLESQYKILRIGSIGTLLTDFIKSEFIEDIKKLMRASAESNQMNSIVNSFSSHLSRTYIPSTEERIVSFSYDPLSTKVYAVVLDKNGKVIDTQIFEYIMTKLTSIIVFEEKNKYYAEQKRLLKLTSSVKYIVIGVNDLRCKELKRILMMNGTSKEIKFVDGRFSEIYMKSDLARKENADIFEDMKRDENDFAFIAYAISIGRIAINGLYEISHIFIKNNLILDKLGFLGKIAHIKNTNLLLLRLENEIVKRINQETVDLNIIMDNEHLQRLLCFISGLGEKRGYHLYKQLQSIRNNCINAIELFFNGYPKILSNVSPFIHFDPLPNANKEITILSPLEVFNLMLDKVVLYKEKEVSCIVQSNNKEKNTIEVMIMNTEICSEVPYDEIDEPEKYQEGYIFFSIIKSIDVDEEIHYQVKLSRKEEITSIKSLSNFEYKEEEDYQLSEKYKYKNRNNYVSKLSYHKIEDDVDNNRFYNINYESAIKQLRNRNIGEYLYRPSIYGDKFITITIKVDKNVYSNIQINHENENFYKIDNTNYYSFTEISERYVAPLSSYIKKAQSYKKYIDADSLQDFGRKINLEKKMKRQSIKDILYHISFIPSFANYLVLGYLQKAHLVIYEFIKMSVNGFLFHGINFTDIQNLVNYFKEHSEQDKYKEDLHKSIIPKGNNEEIEKELSTTEFEGRDPNNVNYFRNNRRGNNTNGDYITRKRQRDDYKDLNSGNNNSKWDAFSDNVPKWGESNDKKEEEQQGWGVSNDKKIEEQQGWGKEEIKQNDNWGVAPANDNTTSGWGSETNNITSWGGSSENNQHSSWTTNNEGDNQERRRDYNHREGGFRGRGRGQGRGRGRGGFRGGRRDGGDRYNSHHREDNNITGNNWNTNSDNNTSSWANKTEDTTPNWGSNSDNVNAPGHNWNAPEDNNKNVWGKNENEDKKDNSNNTSNWGTSNEQTSSWGNTEQPSSTQNKEKSSYWGEIKTETKEQSSWGVSVNESNLGFGSSSENKNTNEWGPSNDNKNSSWGASNDNNTNTSNWGSSNDNKNLQTWGSSNDNTTTNNWGSSDNNVGSNTWGSSDNNNSWNSSHNDRGGNRKSKGCFNCGEEGHSSRDCPQPRKERNPRVMKCFNCGEEGHMSKDCTQPRKERRPMKCFNCGKEGHSSRDCPQPKKERGPRVMKCFNCGEEGHSNKECPKPKVFKCFNCGKEGHSSRNCPEPQKERSNYHRRDNNNSSNNWNSSSNDNSSWNNTSQVGWGKSDNTDSGWGNSTDNKDSSGWGTQDNKEQTGWGTVETTIKKENTLGTSNDWGSSNESKPKEDEQTSSGWGMKEETSSWGVNNNNTQMGEW